MDPLLSQKLLQLNVEIKNALRYDQVPPVQTQLTELSYSTPKSLTTLSGSSHNVGQLGELNAARR